MQTTAQAASLFAISADETQTFVGPPTVRVTMTDQTTGTAFHVDRWNHGAALPGEIAGFTPLGGALELPPEFSCSVRLHADRPAPARADRRRQPGLHRRRVGLLGGAPGTQRRDRRLGAAGDRRGDPAPRHAGRNADPPALDGRLAGRARRRRRRAADDPGRADPGAVQLGLRHPAPDGDRRHRQRPRS